MHHLLWIESINGEIKGILGFKQLAVLAHKAMAKSALALRF